MKIACFNLGASYWVPWRITGFLYHTRTLKGLDGSWSVLGSRWKKDLLFRPDGYEANRKQWGHRFRLLRRWQ